MKILKSKKINYTQNLKARLQTEENKQLQVVHLNTAK